MLLVALNPTRGSEIRKTRPCVVVSPDELNEHLTTCVVAPTTPSSHAYPFRVGCRFQGRTGQIVLDRIRTVDGARVVTTLGKLSEATLHRALSVLQMMFSP